MNARPLYIVAIGASAGGQDPLKEFFRSIPADSGMAFCVVTHLLRTHESVLDHIISKCTSMQVKRMETGDFIQPDHVYVMPEGVRAFIRHGTIFLRKRDEDSSINRTVDEFFCSLAEDKKSLAIGVILAGMGDDGTLGAQVIHEHGGHVFVQDPNSTEFKSMPENTIRWDHPSEVLPPALIAAALRNFAARKTRSMEK